MAYELEYSRHPFAHQTSLLEKAETTSIEGQVELSNGTDRRLKQFLLLTLKEKEEERASWQELLLSRIFEQPVESREDFVAYLHELTAIAKWMSKNLYNMKDELKSKKKLLKLFLFFLMKFQKSALETELSIL